MLQYRTTTDSRRGGGARRGARRRRLLAPPLTTAAAPERRRRRKKGRHAAAAPVGANKKPRQEEEEEGRKALLSNQHCCHHCFSSVTYSAPLRRAAFYRPPDLVYLRRSACCLRVALPRCDQLAGQTDSKEISRRRRAQPSTDAERRARRERAREARGCSIRRIQSSVRRKQHQGPIISSHYQLAADTSTSRTCAPFGPAATAQGRKDAEEPGQPRDEEGCRQRESQGRGGGRHHERGGATQRTLQGQLAVHVRRVVLRQRHLFCAAHTDTHGSQALQPAGD